MTFEDRGLRVFRRAPRAAGEALTGYASGETMATDPSGSKFRDFYEQVVAEAEAEGPEGVARLEALHHRFRLATFTVECELGHEVDSRESQPKPRRR